MFQYSTVLALWALISTVSIAAPVLKPEVTVVEHSLVQRSEAGPEIGGANFPDPGFIQVGSTWYAFATRTKGTNLHIQVAKSTDFSTWTIVNNADGTQYDALPTVPAWVPQAAGAANTWAPDVQVLADGSYIMYYSATTASDTAKHCVGAATSKTVTGPYTPVGSTALICPLSQGGAIDASGYNDNGSRYIVYKIDGNSIGNGGACGNGVSPYVSTAIMLQPVSSNGYTFTGTATKIMDNNGAGDGGITEAPSLVKTGTSTYTLFFSTGCFVTSTYTVTYATASKITGTYTRGASPLFVTGTDNLTAPGSATIYKDGKHMLFHANQGSGRALFEAIVTINGNKVTA